MSCHAPLIASRELRRAELLFQHGELKKCEEVSALNANRFRARQPDLADRFSVLQAISATWRGKFDDALAALSSIEAGPSNPEIYTKKLSLLGTSLIGLQRVPEAAQTLITAREFCEHHDNLGCVWVLGLESTMALHQEKLPEAYQFSEQALSAARKFHSPMSEASSLLSLGHLCLQQEKYDQAIDWLTEAGDEADKLDASDIRANVKEDLGWAYLNLGDSERALQLFQEAEENASRLGDTQASMEVLAAESYVFRNLLDPARASESLRGALVLARETDNKQDIVNVLEDLAHVSIDMGRLDDAQQYLSEVRPLVNTSGNNLDAAYIALAEGRLAAARHQGNADELFHKVDQDFASQPSMHFAAEHELARLSMEQGNNSAAAVRFKTALDTFESARSQLSKEDSKLPFLANAKSIYDDYIDFLISQNKPEEALLTADQSRARTLAQGLGADLNKTSARSAALHPQAIAQKADATLLFYWLGEKQSWLWAVTPRKITLFPLPPQREIIPLVDHYRKTLLGPTDPAQANDESGEALYNTLVAPAASLIPANSNVMILADGQLSLLNFETLLVPAKEVTAGITPNLAPHYWIEDVNLVSAPSLAMLASAKPSARSDGKLLLLGDAISPEASYPELPLASMEMQQIAKHFPFTSQAVFTRQQANPSTYLTSAPQQYTYIHFVAHGVASRTDPLDSAIILSRSQSGAESNAHPGDDSFKLYARDIMRHPIDARLVTISACYGSGTRSYVGEGLVGLSWAFLRAGAHNTIGALWEASDDSTPRLMDSLYQGLDQGQSPAAALRQAKLELLHSHNIFRRPFYWAPFQIYTRL